MVSAAYKISSALIMTYSDLRLSWHYNCVLFIFQRYRKYVRYTNQIEQESPGGETFLQQLGMCVNFIVIFVSPPPPNYRKYVRYTNQIEQESPGGETFLQKLGMCMNFTVIFLSPPPPLQEVCTVHKSD